MLMKLWKDEAGIVSLEYLILATIVALGVVVGLANFTAGVNSELTELANAVLSLSQGYSVNGTSSCQAFRQGSAATDTAGTLGLTFPSVTTPSVVAVTNCP